MPSRFTPSGSSQVMYGQAVQVVNTIGGTAAGSFTSSSKVGASGSASSFNDVSVGSLESNETITFPPSSSSVGSAGSSTTVTTITESEEQQRFDQALADIAELQKLHPHATFSINSPFALLTSDEFLSYVNRFGIDPDSNPVKNSTSSTAGMFTMDAEDSGTTTPSSIGSDIMTSAAAAGETVDWQEAGCVTAVKDQGECGACWAFSATAAMESGYCVATGSLPSLSDQQLISCHTEDGNRGCGGGYAAYSLDWIANERRGKMCTLDTYPFTSENGNVADPGAIEDAVRKQPVSIFLYSGSTAFQYYSGGVLTGANCDKTGSHSGLAVGFGETEDNILYWRIKNQWGTSWGEDGYVRVQRRFSGDSEGACGVELYATWPTFDVSATPTSSPTPTTSAPSGTAATPSVTTATPPITTMAPSTNPVTDTPSATNAVVDQAASASAASGSDSTITKVGVDQMTSATSGSTAHYETVKTDPVGGSLASTATPAATAIV
ncbi:Papain family cysteine protease [Phytophthora infestans]|uniref:Papain family cysteine protease n=1 Tax=Phytophthora infestans TaxID=4787 RepID=A0A8S9TRV1_PHYIN|nr:Papain family cysteine protease [Phytophthora infestans]